MIYRYVCLAMMLSYGLLASAQSQSLSPSSSTETIRVPGYVYQPRVNYYQPRPAYRPSTQVTFYRSNAYYNPYRYRRGTVPYHMRSRTSWRRNNIPSVQAKLAERKAAGEIVGGWDHPGARKFDNPLDREPPPAWLMPSPAPPKCRLCP